MHIKEQIAKKLQEKFQPQTLIVRDDSHKHKGHAGARPEGETHFFVEINSAELSKMNRLEAQRSIYALLDPELSTRVHALELKIHRQKLT